MFRIIQHYYNRLYPAPGNITLCLPAYNAAPFIEETLEAIQRQTYQNFQCLVSIDLSEDNTEEKIKPFLSDGRLKIYRQKKRLGWAGNINFLLNKVSTRYVCIVPHDDVIHPGYLQSLLPIIEKDQNIAAVFSDINLFGNGKQGVIMQTSVTGSKPERVLDYLNHHYNSVVFRGIVNRDMVGDDIYCSWNHYDDFSEDTIWGLKLAIHGQLIRHPEVLYSKRYLETSHHYKWQQWEAEKKVNAWAYHCAKCLQVIKEETDLKEYQEEIAKAIVNRTLQSKKDLWRRSELQEFLHVADMTPKLLSAMLGAHE